MKPKRLKQGDTIKLVAPASCPDLRNLKSGMNYLQEQGFDLKLGDTLKHLTRYWSFSGTEQQRADEINRGFRNPEVDAIFCVRGGYGSPQICDKLDYELIRENPKVFVGYSDITSLHLALQSKTGLVTFHGPMVGTDFGQEPSTYTQKMFQNAVSRAKPWTVDNPDKGPLLKVLNEGQSKGTLMGGNLSLISTLMGTPYEPDLQGKILFLEEVDEPIYAVDRYLTQLRLANLFEGIVGLIIGESVECEPKSGGSPGLEELVYSFFDGFDIPILYNLACGHGEDKATLPEGVLAKLDTNRKDLEILESPVR